VPDLIALLDRAQRTDFMQIREHAAQALVWMGDERALEPLRAAAERGGLFSRRRLRRFAQQLAAVVAP
jgi:HEAT repeat protein